MSFIEELRDRKELLTIAEAASLLRLSPKTLRNWADKNVFPATKLSGKGAAGDWRIDPTLLADWYAARETNQSNGSEE
jgi:excisionase family DNA binding protein